MKDIANTNGGSRMIIEIINGVVQDSYDGVHFIVDSTTKYLSMPRVLCYCGIKLGPLRLLNPKLILLKLVFKLVLTS